MTKGAEPPAAMYGLPQQVAFCKKCVMSNQRPVSALEFRHSPDSVKTTLHLDANGVCDACRQSENKANIDWKERKDQLCRLLGKHRRNDGEYDCVVPGSGGKDSAFAAHVLKYEYGMHPITVTWAPILHTDYGYQNHLNWLQVGGFDNFTFRPNGQVMKLLTKLSIVNIFHPFQTFILGQKNIGAKVAKDLDIPLVFYGENEAEYGNPIANNDTSLRDASFYSADDLTESYLAGMSLGELMEKHNLDLVDLKPFLPIEWKASDTAVEVHYLGYYLRWTPQEVYYYAVEHTGFQARPFRSQGSFSKYNSIDDKIDDLHYYTTFIKFGIGRATYDASQEIRNGHLTREEGMALVKRFDGEFPDIYFDEIMAYLELDPNEFHRIGDRFRPSHLWAHVDGEWKVRHTVNGDGVDD